IEDTLRGVMIETAKTTSLVFIILLGAAMLTAAFRAFGGEELVKHFLEGLPGGFWTKFIIVMAVIFILGFFLDFIEIAVVVVPIVAPILLSDPSANITAVWLGVMIGLNIQTSFLTPPFGFALFYLRGVAPATVKTLQMYKGVIAFIGLQIGALIIVGLYPALVNYLPNRSLLLSETAPPPRNPNLQYCIEQYVSEQFAENGDRIRSAISGAQALNISYLPEDVSKEFLGATKEAEKSFGLLTNALAAEEAVIEATPQYRPLHSQVRSLEREMRIIDAQLKTRENDLKRVGNAENAEERKAAINASIDALKAERSEIEARIPDGWADANKQFTGLLKEESKLRLQYRRAVDSAYEPVSVLIETLQGSEAFTELREPLDQVISKIRTTEPVAMIDEIKALEDQLGAIEGPGEVKKALSKARRALKAKTPDPEKAFTEARKAGSEYTKEARWRAQASESGLLAEIEGYEAEIRGTIGLRQLEDMPRDLGLYIAGCNSGHRDISLNF
ncbi:MAG: TRAP transporter large permease subunit, partial [Pseudomonadota bacterium]